MTSISENRSVARAAGVLAILGHLLAAFLYIVFPGLEVEYPTLFAFQAAWLIVLVVAVWWLRAHPWRSVGLVLAGAVLVNVARILGEQYLGFHG
jgi:hypothetical protein